MWESWLEPPEFDVADCVCNPDAWDECVCDLDDEGCGSCNSKRGCRCDDLYDEANGK